MVRMFLRLRLQQNDTAAYFATLICITVYSLKFKKKRYELFSSFFRDSKKLSLKIFCNLVIKSFLVMLGNDLVSIDSLLEKNSYYCFNKNNCQFSNVMTTSCNDANHCMHVSDRIRPKSFCSVVPCQNN
jgi:hypothetical protein